MTGKIKPHPQPSERIVILMAIRTLWEPELRKIRAALDRLEQRDAQATTDISEIRSSLSYVDTQILR